MAHILGRPVLGQTIANVRFCVLIRKGDDDSYTQFKTAQKVLNKQVMTMEEQLSSSKSRQTVLDLTSPGQRTVTGEVKIVESKTLDSVIADVFYENALPFNVADLPSLARMVEKCIEFGQQHPGRSRAGRRVQSPQSRQGGPWPPGWQLLLPDRRRSAARPDKESMDRGSDGAEEP